MQLLSFLCWFRQHQVFRLTSKTVKEILVCLKIIYSLYMTPLPRTPFPLPHTSTTHTSHAHTALLLAYIGGSTVLCDALIKAGAHPGISNKQGLSIFNSPVATKQLLFRVLDQIHTEPMWLDGGSCFNCSMKFNISHRKHHWYAEVTEICS